MEAWRDLTPDALPRAAALSAACGWNQVQADWRVFLDHGRARALDDGHPDMLAATAAVLPFGPDLAWISMVLVRPDRRRAGLATALMRWALDALAATRCVALDATAEGREVYRRLGFADLWTFTRWSLPDALPEATPGRGPPADAAALDHAALGARRDALLDHLRMRLPAAAVTLPGGAALGRDGRLASQIGPILAEDDATARALLSRLRSAVNGPLIADLRDGTDLAAWAAASGGTARRRFTRMARGTSPHGRTALIHAVAGPEFG
ncbi:GNAT family N-acetyltransferase [Roseomonas sp. CCTCC AB2023176]|uniref:GNAT family N-acetyltransferase n=1 Tax=Roseomonas sp. CCTCC AB2023176 TaxID=3342640 RepID=UPI0035DEAB6C